MAEPVFNLVVIRSADLDRAAHFYGSLGIALRRERHGNGPEHLAGRVGAVVFEVYPSAEGDRLVGVGLGFKVGSVADSVTALQAVGGLIVSPLQPSLWGFRAVVSDPDGHRIELTEATPDPTES